MARIHVLPAILLRKLHAAESVLLVLTERQVQDARICLTSMVTRERCQNLKQLCGKAMHVPRTLHMRGINSHNGITCKKNARCQTHLMHSIAEQPVMALKD